MYQAILYTTSPRTIRVDITYQVLMHNRVLRHNVHYGTQAGSFTSNKERIGKGASNAWTDSGGTKRPIHVLRFTV